MKMDVFLGTMVYLLFIYMSDHVIASSDIGEELKGKTFHHHHKQC